MGQEKGSRLESVGQCVGVEKFTRHLQPSRAVHSLSIYDTYVTGILVNIGEKTNFKMSFCRVYIN